MNNELENTAGEVAFNPTDKDFLQKDVISSIDTNHPKALVKINKYEHPSTAFSLRTLVIWYITAVTSVKKLLFSKLIKMNSYWFDGISTACREVKENSYSWRALEIIYNLPTYAREKKSIDSAAQYWNGLENAKAVRNRLLLTKKILHKEFLSRSPNSIRILSVASGSARAILEVLSELKKSNNINFKFKLLDLDPTAIEYAKKLSKELGVSEYCEMINGSTTNMKELLSDYEPDIIEMVGFLEYRKTDKAINLLQRLKSLLSKGGTIIISQVKPNREMYFLRWVMNWPMIYRTKQEFANLLNKAGYKNATIEEEPTGIHMVSIYKKN